VGPGRAHVWGASRERRCRRGWSAALAQTRGAGLLAGAFGDAKIEAEKGYARFWSVSRLAVRRARISAARVRLATYVTRRR